MLTFCVRWGHRSAYFRTWRESLLFALTKKKWSIWSFNSIRYELITDSSQYNH
jgi:hypothetical protein